MKTKMKTLMIAMHSERSGLEEPDFAHLRLTGEVISKLTRFRELHRKQAEAVAEILGCYEWVAETATHLVIDDYSPDFPSGRESHKWRMPSYFGYGSGRLWHDLQILDNEPLPYMEVDWDFSIITTGVKLAFISVCQLTASREGVCWKAWLEGGGLEISTEEVPWSVLIGEENQTEWGKE